MNAKTVFLSVISGVAAAVVALSPAALATPVDTASAQHSATTGLPRSTDTALLGRIDTAPLHGCKVIAAVPGRDIMPPTTRRDAGSIPVQQAPPSQSNIDVTC